MNFEQFENAFKSETNLEKKLACQHRHTSKLAESINSNVGEIEIDMLEYAYVGELFTNKAYG